ncbi:hypothetical protein GCM10011529_11130 [Polymorphobacter glacialis]|uniref:DUF3618 domain-containing protein n=1 Tax=Sandarakinorhabdus glacialis TaxID=1614636 RepID=A0A916ZQH6_9SPHN|nr:DUF3618 domain-containing protein [Polymorphobacter glacialis]GGE06521.1 hypothetical protein GCM10011529_11130 [Polymorphobacter glacialis]
MTPNPVEYYANEADEARVRIASTIDEIQGRFDPRRILDEVVSNVSGGSNKLMGQARQGAREHPVAIGAAVAAIGLALLARRKLANATIDMGDDGGTYTDYDDGFGFVEGPSHDLYGDDADAVVGNYPRPRKSLSGALGALNGGRQQLAGKAEGAIDSNPLVSILIGLAAGAALGALFPVSEAERRALGQTGARLSQAAKTAARRAADDFTHAVDVVKTTAEDAGRKARGAVGSTQDELAG